MNEQKSLIYRLVETYEHYRAEQRVAMAGSRLLRQSSRLRRTLRWLMPNGGTLLLVAALIATAQVWAKPVASPASAPGPSATTVNYQGRLADSGGTPISDIVTLQFALYDSDTGGSPLWGPETHPNVPVSDGLFSVGLGSQTSGGIPTTTWNGDRYLEITVGGETLNPRELIRSVPIAGMALTVPDGAIESRNLDLDHGTVCLSGPTSIALPGNAQRVDVPGLSLDFSLDSSSQVLVWIDGLARYNDGSSITEASVLLCVDGEELSDSYKYTDTDVWFSVKGQRILSLDSGSHSITVKGMARHSSGSMELHYSGPYQTCVSYLVLGAQ